MVLFGPSDLREMLVGYVDRGDYKSIDKLIDDTVKVSVRNPRDVDDAGDRIMKIHFLGTSHGIAEKGRFRTSMISETGESFIHL